MRMRTEEQKHRQQAKNIRIHEAFIKRWKERDSEVRHLYLDSNLSQEDVAKYYNVSQSLFSKVLKILEIPSKGRGRAGRLHPEFIDGKDSRLYRTKVKKEYCEQCHAVKNLGIHHKDFDHYNDVPDNLQVLCVSCHMSLHKKAYWDAIHSGKEPPHSNGRVGWKGGE